MIQLKIAGAKVTIDSGELISYLVSGHEYIHQKGSPGWGSSDTEMFPIIGPTHDANFQVQTPRDIAIQDQHGLLREMAYECISTSETQAIFQKKYLANTRVKNSKYPKKSSKEFLFWPYDFVFTKTFVLSAESLEIVFKVDAPRDTPFMLGYHPAFKLHATAPKVKVNSRTISIDEIMAVGSRAYEIPNCTEIVLQDARETKITTTGFGNFMLWTEVPNMLCIEPISFYPYAVQQQNLHEGFRYTQDTPIEFKISIQTTSH